MESDNITMAELRGMAREIEEARKLAEVRRSSFGMALLDESLSAFNLDEDVVVRIEKLKGERLYQLQQELFAVFAKAGKRITEESFEQRVRVLLVRYATTEKRPCKKRQTESE
jgi:hypothetical protein